MNDFQSQLNRAVTDFAKQITELGHRLAVETMKGALDSGGGGGRRASAAIVIDGEPRGGKRSPDELDKLAESFATFVKANPGLRIEQINKQLGTTTKALALPIRKLLGEGTIHVKGQKRSTAYFPGTGGGSNGGGGKKKKKSTK